VGGKRRSAEFHLHKGGGQGKKIRHLSVLSQPLCPACFIFVFIQANEMID